MTTSSFRKDVTDAEIAEFMGPRLEELMARVVMPTPAPTDHPEEPSARREKPRRVAPEPSQQEEPFRPPKPQQEIKLSSEEHSFLLSTAEEPLLTVTRRRMKLGLASDAATTIRKKLRELGLIQEISVNLGRSFGGRALFVEPSSKGSELLGRPLPPRSPENVSAEHFWWQRQIAAHYRGRGFGAEIEHSLGGKRADVGVFAKSQTLAVEVELSSSNAGVNVLKDLNAGFSKVLVGAASAALRAAIQEQVDEVIAGDDRARVAVKVLADLPFVRLLK